MRGILDPLEKVRQADGDTLKHDGRAGKTRPLELAYTLRDEDHFPAARPNTDGGARNFAVYGAGGVGEPGPRVSWRLGSHRGRAHPSRKSASG